MGGWLMRSSCRGNQKGLGWPHHLRLGKKVGEVVAAGEDHEGGHGRGDGRGSVVVVVVVTAAGVGDHHWDLRRTLGRDQRRKAEAAAAAAAGANDCHEHEDLHRDG